MRACKVLGSAAFGFSLNSGGTWDTHCVENETKFTQHCNFVRARMGHVMFLLTTSNAGSGKHTN